MIVLVMGVAGSGKTTIGKLLAKKLASRFLDADDFHSSANIEKMKRGIPLTDADREPWLHSIHEELVRLNARNCNVVLACSALKEKYRSVLGVNLDLRIVYLKGPYETMRQRIASRTGHFAHENILAEQFADLEEPTDAITIDVIQTPEQMVAEICAHLSLAK